MKNKLLFVLVVLVFTSTVYSQFKLPAYEKFTLPNGLTVYLMEKKDVPLISISTVFDAGTTKDGLLSGIASFTAEALKFGTTNYSKSQIDSIFNYYGSNLVTYSTLDYAGMNATIMKDDFDVLFPVLKEVMTTPTFPESEFEKRKQRWIVELDQAKESPRAVIGSYFNKFLFGSNEYGNPVDGTKKSIEGLSNTQIKNFYNSYYRPEKSAIALVGDFDISSMKINIEKEFVAWSKSGLMPVTDIISNESKFTEPKVYLINKPNATETTFLIGGYGTLMNNSEQTQIDVINTILGGRFTSWLNDELRVNAGYTYGARSRFASYKSAGTFYISTFTATKNTEPAIDLALKTYNKLFEQGIDEATLTSAKNYVKGQFPPDFETAGSLAGLLTQMYVYDLSDSYINDFEKNVDELTVAKANEIIKKYFPKDNLQFVMIGKASEIKDIVKKYGKVVEKELSEDSF
ncbi:MAG: insulinase family protein [Ignavibacteriales bacterium]|nr:MAG: insulinase family protein [Ignavibacteriales bacterium]